MHFSWFNKKNIVERKDCMLSKSFKYWICLTLFDFLFIIHPFKKKVFIMWGLANSSWYLNFIFFFLCYREEREKSHHFSIFHTKLQLSMTWNDRDTNTKNNIMPWKCQSTPQSSTVSSTTLYSSWNQFQGIGALLSNPALYYHFSSLTSFIYKQLFPWFTAIHTYVIQNLPCCISWVWAYNVLMLMRDVDDQMQVTNGP